MEEVSKRVVPWISVEEWTRVYQQVYSDNLEEKWIGLNQMTLWKSRVAKLSLGVECSLYLLQAILRDEEYKVDPKSALSESDVALMYSTAIIRFINLVSHLGQVDLRHQPISAIADMVGIPDWLVSIRHEATHAKMPSLEILRPGAQMAMEWLKENYWRTEEEDSFDLYWPESNKATSRMLRATKKMVYERKRKGSAPSNSYEVIPEELKIAVSMVIALLKEMSSKHSLNEIQSRDLHQYSYEIWQQSKTIPVSLSEKEIANLDIPLKKIRAILFIEIERILSEWVEIDGGKNGESTEVNVDPLKAKCLISALCQCPHLLKNAVSGTLFTNLLPIWKMIKKWKMVPELLFQLTTLETQNEQEQESLLRLFCDLTDIILRARDNLKADNQAKFDVAMGSPDWHRIAMAILHKEPHPETWNAVSRLFRLYDPPVEEKRREKVAELLRLYLGKDSRAEQPKRVGCGPPEAAVHGKIYTVEMLNPSSQKKQQANGGPNDKHPVGGSSTTDPAPVIDEWTLCTEFNWSRIPLGSTPGVKKTSQVELKGVEWQLVEAETNNFDCDPIATKRTGERFDWNSLTRKRRRRGGQTKEGTVGQQQQQQLMAPTT